MPMLSESVGPRPVVDHGHRSPANPDVQVILEELKALAKAIRSVPEPPSLEPVEVRVLPKYEPEETPSYLYGALDK